MSWANQAELLTKVYWRGNISKTEFILNQMLASLTDCIHKRVINQELLTALYQVADFFCFEGRFADAERLCEMVLHAQKSVLQEDAQATKDTRQKLERIRYVWNCSRSPEESLRHCFDSVICISQKMLEIAS